ncbi:hypothetical protein FA95DRAFT_1553853 [Auriscalpium vulgare]|uniref:Uncharacterized protein n=1 Tax=Auriscalpium vulgare TaxID=40419 RepID=A0ACB8S8P9_9AGAM|nr:hypothetical protein FA95DRAFT_1553853 [Auriscalpium vulgare]
MGQWTAPPTRRELTLLLFCVTVFIIAYNANTSLRLLGIDSVLPFASQGSIGPDGRRIEGYRDNLEDEIFGDWDWEEGHIAGVKTAEASRVFDKKGDKYLHGEGVSGRQAMWLQGVGEGLYGQGEGLGTTSVNDESVRWDEHVPRTTLVRHIPGFTILDNVIMAFGTMFLVTDDPSSMPNVDEIGSSMVDHKAPPRDIDLQILPGHNALSKLGPFGGRMHGVTFMSYDPPTTTDSHTLLSLQRLYTTINASSPFALSRPHRLLLPSIPTFADKKPEPDDESHPRQRSSAGVHPLLLKAAYPSLAGPLFAEDVDDFTGMGAPLLLDRLVVADRRAMGAPGWSRAFTDVHVSSEWFEPVRRTLAGVFGAQDTRARGGFEVTYLAPRAPLGSAALRDADHRALLDALKGLHHDGVTVHVVTDATPWAARMEAIVHSTVVLGVYGEHLSDAVFMRPSQHATLVELFPASTFTRDWELVIRSMGINYIAFQGDRQYTGDTLPPVSNVASLQDIHVDALAVARAISDALSRRV